MPVTYNGVGTHYYGKKNFQSRPGVCRQCGRSVTLSSYDTRLWFVIVFIPVIPIGRKRIIDACSACRRHYVLDLRKWETARQLEVSGALEKFRSDPTPDTAIQAHRQLLAFHQTAEAADLQKMMVETFPDNARIYAYLGAAWTEFGRTNEADEFFAKALALRPDMPEARIGVASAYIRGKRLDEARKLLDFMEKPGVGQLYALAPLEQLALAYQQMGRHEEALALFGRLLAELPNISQHKGFRKAVQKSETALKQRNSILPKRKFSWRGLFQPSLSPQPSFGGGSISARKLLIILGGAAALVSIALALSNENIRRHRKLYVANAFGRELHLEISGIGPVKLERGFNQVNLPEGHYTAKFTGPIWEEVGVDIRDSYFDRWAGKPLWLLNPGGAAILMFERVTYSANPPPAYFTFEYGKNFQLFSRIDHPFEPMPHSVTLPSGTSEETLTGLDLFREKPISAFYALERARRKPEAVSLAEWDLRLKPDDKEMLEAYTASVTQKAELARLDAFLGAGLSNRPVNIEWHRSYQDIHLSQSNGVKLISLYEGMLKAEPENSALLYLRGRICGDRAEGRDFFKRAFAADETNPYPIYALAHEQASLGHWDLAKPLLTRVVELRPDDLRFRDDWKTVCIAVGKPDEAEQVYRAELKREPGNWKPAYSLCDVLVAEGKREEAQQVISNVVRIVRFRDAEAAEEIRQGGLNRYYYAVGDFAALEKAARTQHDEAGKTALFSALIEQNRVEEAVKIYPMDKISNPHFLLAVSLAWRVAGKTDEAEKWLAPVLKSFRSGGADSLRAANLLEGKVAPTQSALDDVGLPSQFKAVLIAYLAATHPERRDELNALSQRLMVDRFFPYHLVKRATAGSS